jgi:hypothetical protein
VYFLSLVLSPSARPFPPLSPTTAALHQCNPLFEFESESESDCARARSGQRKAARMLRPASGAGPNGVFGVGTAVGFAWTGKNGVY